MTGGTNKQGTELFSGVADIRGEGLPFSFLFIDKCAPATTHAKQFIIDICFTALKSSRIGESIQSSRFRIRINQISMPFVLCGQMRSTIYVSGMFFAPLGIV
jgi:hypothetical protein